MFVKGVKSKLIKNSRGDKTIEITLNTYEGKFSCSAPSGKSTGKTECPEFSPKGINYSLKLLKHFSKVLIHKNFKIKKLEDLKPLIELIKKFEKKYGPLGRSVTYSLEGCFLKASAKDQNIPLFKIINNGLLVDIKPKIPMPIGNAVGGGLHSKGIKGKKPDFQEFLLIPKEKRFSKAITNNLHAYYDLKKILKYPKINDENALETKNTNEEVLEIIKKIAKKRNLRIGLDIASSSFYKGGYYYYKNKKLIRDKVDQEDYVEKIIKKYGIYYVEDPMNQEDFSGFKQLTSFVNKTNKKVLITGDDLTTTSLSRTRRAIQGECINAIIIKPNQTSSILEVKKVVELCKKYKIKTIFSHRSGETVDDILAEYAVGFGADFIKCGIIGKERLIKLKRITEIEKILK